MTDFETHERQEDILALIKLMQYAASVASDLNSSAASFHIQAAESALFTVLEAEFPSLSRQQLRTLTGDTQHGYC